MSEQPGSTRSLRRYQEATSEWTLDYPPSFAWFEWWLAQIARLVDPNMLRLEVDHSPSPATMLFQVLFRRFQTAPAWHQCKAFVSCCDSRCDVLALQRLSVIASDAVLVLGVLYAIRYYSVLSLLEHATTLRHVCQRYHCIVPGQLCSA